MWESKLRVALLLCKNLLLSGDVGDVWVVGLVEMRSLAVHLW